MATRYGAIAPRDLADFVRKSQMAMYETYKAMYEGRQAKLFNPCSGVLTWMSNPSQPSFVWQIYSHDLEPLAALYGAKKACEPLHVQLNQDNWHVMVINTLPQPRKGLQAVVRIYDMDGTQRSQKALPVDARPCAATDLGAAEWPAGLSPVHYVKLELKDARGEVISDNFYWRTTAQLAADAAPQAADNFGAGAHTSARVAVPGPRGRNAGRRPKILRCCRRSPRPKCG